MISANLAISVTSIARGPGDEPVTVIVGAASAAPGTKRTKGIILFMESFLVWG